MAVDRSALAHPLRSRIVAHLRTHGAATSADLARALDTSTGVTSYHLRLLADGGLIEDSPGPGRRRVWEISDPGSEQHHLADGPEAEALDTWLEHDLVDLFATRAHAHVDAVGQEAADSGTASLGRTDSGWSGLQDDAVLVSRDQATALRAELDAVLQRYRRIGQGTPGARRVVAWTALLPVD
ncbi:ArsR/SmtB family transcription factor [Kytococcus sp. Marseille-QA3725]